MANIEEAHYFGLYGALAGRYWVRGKQINEAHLMAELVPFCAMKNEQQAIEALTEYVLYQEERTEARTEWLKWNINAALQSCKEEHLFGMAALAIMNRVSWCNLLDQATIEAIAHRSNKTQEHDEKIIIECPVCQQRLRVPSGRQGRVTCSKCEHVFEVGGTDSNAGVAESCLRNGLKCQAEEDYPEAVRWFRKATELENANAQFNLAALYASGKGVPQDNEYAALLFCKAGNQGIAVCRGPV